MESTDPVDMDEIPATPPDLIIEGGVALTMAQDPGLIEHARIIISGGQITDIQSARIPSPLFNPETEVIDARDSIILPGLINCHTHTAMTLFRGLADDLPLKTWLFEKIFPAECEFLDPETVYYGALLGCMEMIASGTTCFADGYFFQDETVRAAHESGLRGLIAQGVIDLPAPGVPDPAQNLARGREFIERWLHFSPRIRPGLFCHSPITCSEETLIRSMEISQGHHLPLQIHLSETAEEIQDILNKSGLRPAQYLDQLGLLNPGLIAAHALHLDEKEMDLIRERGVNLVHVPESNMKLASGTGPIWRMLRRGVNIGLGTDGACSNNDLDLFCEMDTAAKLAKAVEHDPTSLSAGEALHMATVGGARALGLQNYIGTLERGKRADIITVDLTQPHLCPLHNPVSTLVYAANGGDVKDVIVDGIVLMKNRKFTMLEPDPVMAKMREMAKRIAP